MLRFWPWNRPLRYCVACNTLLWVPALNTQINDLTYFLSRCSSAGYSGVRSWSIFIGDNYMTTISALSHSNKPYFWLVKVELFTTHYSGHWSIDSSQHPVEIGDVKRFATFYHLNSFVGLLPMEQNSGQKENKLSLTVRKHRQLRSELVESAWTAKRTDPAMALYFQEQVKRKDSSIVIIKIARNMLNRIRYVLINQQSYKYGLVK